MINTSISNLTVTVSAIRIDGKKLTKSLFDQFRRRSLLRSETFANLRFGDDDSSFSIIAQHNYQIKENFHCLHILYSVDNEIFVDDIDPEHNIVLEDLQSINKTINKLEIQLAASMQINEGSEICDLIWTRLTEGETYNSYNAFYDSIFGEDTPDIKTLKSALESDRYLSQSDFETIFASQELSSLFKGHVQEKAKAMSSLLPDQISKYRIKHDSLLNKYNLVMGWISKTPKILVGV